MYVVVLRLVQEGHDAGRACDRTEAIAAANPEAASRPDMRARLEDVRLSYLMGRSHVEKLEQEAETLHHEQTMRMLRRMRSQAS